RLSQRSSRNDRDASGVERARRDAFDTVSVRADGSFPSPSPSLRRAAAKRGAGGPTLWGCDRGAGEKGRIRHCRGSSRWFFSFTFAHSSASPGASFFSVIDGHALARSALSAI